MTVIRIGDDGQEQVGVISNNDLRKAIYFSVLFRLHTIAYFSHIFICKTERWGSQMELHLPF